MKIFFKHFVQKLYDVVGLYLNPPDKSLALCVVEKSQIQVLDRTQPGLEMKKGRCGTMKHDYKHHGTITLFVGLGMLDGKVIGEWSVIQKLENLLGCFQGKKYCLELLKKLKGRILKD